MKKQDSVLDPETISFSVGYKSDKAIFHLRMATVQEEQEFLQRFNDISDAEKTEKEYEILVDILKGFSIAQPEKLEIASGKQTRSLLIVEASSPSEAVAAYFAERSTVKERIANSAVMAYRS